MITLYTWSTPNGRKISIALEECGLPYEVRPINIGADDQFTPEFLALNPNGKIPVIVDSEGPDGKPITICESGAILIYLAEKTGRFLPKDAHARYQALQWLMFQMGGFGPMLGQAHHFLRFAPEPVPYAANRYHKESQRLYGVLDKGLEGKDYIAGEYSIADMALYPWAARHEWHQVDLAAYPNVAAWYARVGARPAVQRGMALPKL